MIQNVEIRKWIIIFIALLSLGYIAVLYNGLQTTVVKHSSLSNISKQATYAILRTKATYLIKPWKFLLEDIDEGECIKEKDIRWSMIIIIKSAASNQQRRELLRRTWASISYVDGGRFETVFVIGRTDNKKVSNLIAEESTRYGDLLQYNDSDSYNDITLKTLAGMQWASENFPQNYFYSTVDDDFMINMGDLQESVDDSIRQMNETKWPMFPIVCGFIKGENEKPMRVTGYKWTISTDEYKWPDYPTYCHGGLYTTSVEVIEKLFDISRSTTILRLDDVWITGILRRKLGMTDSMVIMPLAAGHHFNGFSQKGSESRIEYMKSDWENIVKLFKDKTLC